MSTAGWDPSVARRRRIRASSGDEFLEDPHVRRVGLLLLGKLRRALEQLVAAPASRLAVGLGCLAGAEEAAEALLDLGHAE